MIHLDLQPELEAQLALEAQTLGLSTAQYVEHIVSTRSSEEDQFSQIDALEGIRRGLEEQRAGKGRPAIEFLDEMRAKYAIPR